MLSSLSAWGVRVYRGLVSYALKFGAVGAVGYAIDVGIFNALVLGTAGSAAWFAHPMGAKAVSVTVATLVTWFGNRFWTFRERRRANVLRELIEFAAIALVGMGIAVACLYVSHYVLGFTSLLADNISSNVVGLALATTFRFLMYRFWVYGAHRTDGLHHQAAVEQISAGN